MTKLCPADIRILSCLPIHITIHQKTNRLYKIQKKPICIDRARYQYVIMTLYMVKSSLRDPMELRTYACAW